MPYAFAPRANSAIGESRELDLPVGDWAALKFDAGAHDTIFGAISRFTEDQIWDSPDVMRPDLATKVFGIPGYLKFDEPISIQRARLIRERKDEELRRLSYLNSATHSSFSLKAALGTASGMVGAVSNPLDFSAMFIPFVGSEASAVSGIPRMGGYFERAAMAARNRGSVLQSIADRGLLTTTEAIGGRFPHFGAAVINGAMGNAVTEIPVFAQNVRDQAIYGPEDAALNVFLGGATGGAFHLAGAGLGKLLRLAADSHNRMSPDLQDAAARKATNDLLDDKPVSIEGIARTDRDAILRDLQFDEVAARRRALESIGTLPEEAQARAILEGLNRRQASAIDLLDLTRAKANTGEGTIEGKVAARLLQRFQQGERGVDLFKQMADLFEVKYSPLAPTVQERMKADNLDAYFGDIQDGVGAAAAMKRARTELFQVQQAIARLSDDIAKTKDPAIQQRLKANLANLEGRKARVEQDVQVATAANARQPLTPDELSAHADEIAARSDSELDAQMNKWAELEAKAETIRAARVQELIDAERAKHQASLEDRMDAETVSRIRQDIRDGKILTDEEIKSFTKDPTDEAGMTAIKESVASLEKDLSNLDPESPVSKLVQAELARIDAESGPDLKKAYAAAADCLVTTL